MPAVRVKTASGWQDVAITGSQGPQGVQGSQGVQGPQGPPPNFRGPWANFTDYAIGDVVNYQGSSYASTTTKSGGLSRPAPLNLLDGTVSAGWALVASKGDAPSIPIEGWHTVGAAGEPAFIVASGWHNYDTSVYPAAAFRKYPDGRVRLRGLVAGGTIGQASPIFVLPAGYWPSRNLIFSVVSNDVAGEVRIASNGSVYVQVGNTNWVSLDGIEFDTEAATWPAGAVSAGASILAVQRDFGIADIWVPLANGGTVARDGAGNPMQITFTPQQDCWWEVEASLTLRTTTAAYNYLYARIDCAPADLDTATQMAMQLEMQHSQVNMYGHRSPQGIFRLKAGVTYTARIGIQIGGGAWDAYVAGNISNITGKAFVAGAANIFTAPTRVSALPANPYDGQEVYFVADAANGVIWHLRYNASSPSAYKWECVGGDPLLQHQGAAEVSVATPGVNTWANPTPALSVTTPLAGDYKVDHGSSIASGNVSGNVMLGLRFGATDQAADASRPLSTSTGGAWAHLTDEVTLTGLAANTVLIQRMQMTVAPPAFYVRGGRIAITPVRVG
jgi:hypothetical protein